jgi:3-hydroxyacyl-CoA dehydrogenase
MDAVGIMGAGTMGKAAIFKKTEAGLLGRKSQRGFYEYSTEI